MKGVSAVIGATILVLIVIALSASYIIFTDQLSSEQAGRTEEQAAQARTIATTLFSIEDVEGRDVLIRNIGSQPLDPLGLLVTVDNEEIAFEYDGIIEVGGVERLTLTELWKVGPGNRRLAIIGTVRDGIDVRVEPNEGAVLDLRFDEGFGTTAKDSSGNGNDGKLGNGNATRAPEWVNGRVGKALSFDGVNDIVEIQDHNSLDLTNKITVESWVRTKSLNDTTIVSKLPDMGTSALWYLTVRGETDNWEFAVRSGSGAADRARAIGSTTIQMDRLYHLVGFYDKTNVKIFVDGREEGSVSHTQEIEISKRPITIGSGFWINVANEFDGIIDEVRIYNRALSPSELYVMKPL